MTVPDTDLCHSSDATAGFSQALKEAATDVIWPTIYVDEVLKTEEWVERA